MNLSRLFARRYLQGKKSTNAINVITWITITGVALGTAALITILSIFNGFGDLVGNLFNAFNPDVKVTALMGKGFQVEDSVIDEILLIDGVRQVSRTMEEKALLEYRDVQDVGTIKGVDDYFREVTSIDSTIREGYYDVNAAGAPKAVAGAGLARRLRINVGDYFTPLKVYMPKKTSALSLEKSFVSRSLQPTGVFSFQQEYDQQYIIAPLAFVQDLTSRDDIGALEVSVRDRDQLPEITAALREIVSDDLRIEDRYEQDAEFLRLMKIEKWMGFAITSLTLVILAFTIVGALWMIVLDKRQDIAIMKSMGSSRSVIFRIFFSTGLLISVTGIVIGLVLALAFYILQKQFGIITIPPGFIVDSYPIEMYALDVILVIITVLGIGALASYLPAHKASQMETIVRID